MNGQRSITKTLFVIVFLFLMVLMLYKYLSVRIDRIIGKKRTASARVRSIAKAFDLYFDRHGCYPNLKKEGLNLLSGEPYSEVFRSSTGAYKMPIQDGYGRSLYIAHIDDKYFIGSTGENGQHDRGGKDDIIFPLRRCSNGSKCFCDWGSSEQIVWLADLPP